MEYRYDDDYRAEWAGKANMGRSRFNAALDRVIAKAWERIRNGNTATDTETAAAETAAASTTKDLDAGMGADVDADVDTETADTGIEDTDADDTCEAR